MLAGATGIASMQLSLTVDAVYDEAYTGDAARIAARLGELVPNLIAFHTTTILTAVLLVVFAAGLKRRLEAQAPAGSLLPAVAASGLLLTSVAGLMGSALDTEFIFAAADDSSKVVPEAAVVFAHWVGTVPWLWVGSGVAALAVAVAALRHRALPRWIGWASLVLGVLTTLVGVSPLQYLAGFPGPVWLLVASLGFLLGDRATTRATTGA